jgi:hypothetical protein
VSGVGFTPASSERTADVARIDELLAQARSGLQRLGPSEAFAAMAGGAMLVDIRPLEQRILRARYRRDPDRQERA